MSTHKDEILAELREEPSYVEVVVRGRSYGFAMSAYGAKMARAQADDDGQPLDAVAALARLGAELGGAYARGGASAGAGGLEAALSLFGTLTGALLDDVATVVLSGMLPFTPDLDHDRVLSWLTPATAPVLLRGIWPSVAAAMPHAVNHGAAGKAKATPAAKKTRT